MALKLLLSIITLFSSIVVFATDPPAPTVAQVPPPPGLVVSLDESLSLLAAAGIVLGVFFIRKEK